MAKKTPVQEVSVDASTAAGSETDSSEPKSSVRRFTVVYAKCNDQIFDGEYFKTKSAVFRGNYPAAAAKKAVKKLRKRSDEEGDCTLLLAIREQTQTRDKKITFYTGTVKKLDTPVEVPKKSMVKNEETGEMEEVVQTIRFYVESKVTRIKQKDSLYEHMVESLKQYSPDTYETYMARPNKAKAKSTRKAKKAAPVDNSEAVDVPAEADKTAKPAKTAKTAKTTKTAKTAKTAKNTKASEAAEESETSDSSTKKRRSKKADASNEEASSPKSRGRKKAVPVAEEGAEESPASKGRKKAAGAAKDSPKKNRAAPKVRAPKRAAVSNE